MVGFKVGNCVILKDFKIDALNGQVAVVKRIYDESRELFFVEMTDTVLNVRHGGGDKLVKSSNMVLVCNKCHKEGTMQYCARCRVAAYCSIECQRRHWDDHKVECPKLGEFRNFSKLPVFTAAMMGDLASVQKMIQEGANPNKANKDDGSTPLSVAAEFGRLDVVQFLVRHLTQKGVDLNSTNNDGKTAIYNAAQKGHLAVVQCLVQQNVDVNKGANDGTTPLFIAAQYGHLAVVECLLSAGADKNQGNSTGWTPLFMAAHKGRSAVVRYLIEQGAEKDKVTDKGYSPLFMAANMGDLEVVQCLVEAGADINKGPDAVASLTPLTVAVIQGHTDVAEYLRQASQARV